MADPARFWNRLAKRYARGAISDPASYQRKLDETQALFTPDMRLLELGCGTGSTALLHAPHVAHIRATDFSEAMIQIARDKAAAAGIGNVAFEVASVDTLAADPSSFDMVLALSLLHLLEDRAPALACIRDLLKPGGYFVSSTVCLGETMGFFRYIAPLGKAVGLLPTLRVFTPDELARSIEEAGFGIETRWQPGKGKACFIIARKPG